MYGPSLPESLTRIAQPTLVVDRAKALRNIDRMAAKAQRSGVRFRPHYKTHQSAAIGEWFRRTGVRYITVSSVRMAEYFADHGWDDITIAFPINRRERERLEGLSRRIRLGLTLDSAEAASWLIGTEIDARIWIDVDVGYHRTGVPFDDESALMETAAVARGARPGIELQGLLTHAGHSYAARSAEEVRVIYHDSVAKIGSARTALHHVGIDSQISIGDTPCCSVVERFEGVDEIRPGNFVFYDLQQLRIGACTEDDLALAVACPVVACYPARAEVVIQGGAVHLSKDSVLGEHGLPIFGRVALLRSGGWDVLPKETCLRSISQEHGVISGPADILRDMTPGDLVLVLPAHACLAADALRTYVTLDGEAL